MQRAAAERAAAARLPVAHAAAAAAAEERAPASNQPRYGTSQCLETGGAAGGTVLVVTGDSGVVNGTGTVRARGADAALDPSQYHPTSSFAGGGGGRVEFRSVDTADVRGGGGCQRGGAGTVFYRAKAELDINNTPDDFDGGDHPTRRVRRDLDIRRSRSPQAPSFSSSVPRSAGEPIAVVTDSLVLRDHSELEVTHDIAAPR